MRSDKQNNKKKGKNGFSRFTKVWAVFYALVTIAFAGAVIYFDVLPFKELCVAIGAIAVFFLLLFPALFFRNFKKSRKTISLILSVLMIVVYGAGMYYIAETMDFFSKVTQISVQTEDYYVLVRADSDYTDVASIKGKKVETYLSNEFKYSEAKNQLKEEAQVEYEMLEGLSGLAEGLLNSTYDILFISDAHYSTICSSYDSFKTDTKIIHTVKVELESKDIAKTVNVTEEPFNVYISGLDTEGDIGTVSRSDVNMIVTVNPKTHKILLTSIPRDYYVALPGQNDNMDKLTHSGLYGIEETVATAEKLLGIDINYYAKVNYTTVMELVNAIDGIDVESDYTFVTHGMSVYYQFYEGQNHLDGSMALAFARERKSFADGDFQRNRNQQKVLEAILKKSLSSTTILTRYTTILNAVENSVDLNMTSQDMQKLIKMQLDGMPSWDIEKQNILGDVGYEVCYSEGDYRSVVLSDTQSVVTAVDKIASVMEDEADASKSE